MMSFSLSDQHRSWLNPLQSEGLVVSPMALEDAQLGLGDDLRDLQQSYLSFLDDGESPDRILSWPTFARRFLDWPERFIVEDQAVPDELKLFLPEYNEELAPTFVLYDNEELPPPFLLGRVCDATTDLDKIDAREGKWPASPVRKIERLLRETGIPVGLLTNHREIKLVYAPRGENVGILTFPAARMAEVWARPVLGALRLLLDRNRLWADVRERRLPALLDRSRKAQAAVSTELAGQVLGALYELLRGFAGAHELSQGVLLDAIVAKGGQEVYGGLLAVLMRLVFLLYAEDRGLMPATDIYEGAYSVHGLWKKLRDEYRLFPDTMDRRYGSWARLLALFRVVHEGCGHPALPLPPRYGHLFDPERFPFLEGKEDIPAVSDGTISRVLDYLLILNGEKLSYRSLDVEQIGSVYEAVMGFRFQAVSGLSIAVKPKKAHGAPPIVNLEELLALKGSERSKSFKEGTDRDLGAKTAAAVKNAATIDELLDALSDLRELRATPHPVAKGGWVLQPTDERRRSGSHYTPRSLTEPIVRKALEPIWAQLGDHPAPEDIKALKVCDPAMGSGAFLVEACRQIAERLADSWHYHRCVPAIPADEDELLYAKRVVAQRCLYGVDRNPMAVDLAKLSLWLATLAKDHPFTFLDHSFRSGDSLVGLSKRQIVAFHWDEGAPYELGRELIEQKVLETSRIRRRILDSEENLSPETKAAQLSLADEALSFVRLAGDLTTEAWFSADKDAGKRKRREENLNDFKWALDDGEKKTALETRMAALRHAEKPLAPFHWEIEFPEVFSGERPGFDVFVGNPPFMGGSKISSSSGKEYLNWLLFSHPLSHGNGDLVAHFFRRAYTLLRSQGTFGLIATNTIAQGDTRQTGLTSLRLAGAWIYNAVKRYKWPGEAAVIVSIVHVFKTSNSGTSKLPPVVLNSISVDMISAFLVSGGRDQAPRILLSLPCRGFRGAMTYGQGFVFDDNDTKANSISDMKFLINKDIKNKERIFPYLGGEDVNTSPTHAYHRYVINFGEMTEAEARQWPDLVEVVERKVRPEREKNNREIRRRYWWHFGENTPALSQALKNIQECFVISRHTQYPVFARVKTGSVFSESMVIFPTASLSFFCVLQSRFHETWARFFASSMKDDLRYTPSDCFETFPFPSGWDLNADLEAAGKAYYDFRAELMVRRDEGLTTTYNRFHDPDETDADTARLRDLHAAMDRTVMDAYGFSDLDLACEFYLDYEEEDEEGGRRRKKPWRFRWSDEVRDEALARLLDLNAERAAAQGEAPAAEGEDDQEEDAE